MRTGSLCAAFMLYLLFQKRKCKNCGKLSHKDVLFCWLCGCSFDHRICVSGHKNPPWVRHCLTCGTDRSLKSHLISNGAGSSRVAGITYALKNALAFARDVLSVPVMNVALIRAPGAARRQVVYLTPDEYSEFVEAIPLYTGFGHQRLSQFCFRALVETLAATGMRISEALSW